LGDEEREVVVIDEVKKVKVKQIQEGGRDKDFLWLLKLLLPNPDNPKERVIKGC
jgi:hypothetical protein